MTSAERKALALTYIANLDEFKNSEPEAIVELLENNSDIFDATYDGDHIETDEFCDLIDETIGQVLSK